MVENNVLLFLGSFMKCFFGPYERELPPWEGERQETFVQKSEKANKENPANHVHRNRKLGKK